MSDGTTTAEATAREARADEEGVAEQRFDELLESLDEPELLTGRRRAAWERYLELPMPGTESEEWRYTDVEDLTPVESFRPLVPEAPREEALEDLPASVRSVLSGEQARSAVSVEVDGATAYRRLDEELQEQGVVFAPIREVAASRPELLEEFLFTSDVAEMEEKLWTLHVALLTQGYVLHVPDGVAVPDPIHNFRYLEAEGSLLATHTLVLAGENAEVTCIDEYLSPDLEEPAMSVNGAEVVGRPGATVRYLSLNRFGAGVSHFSIQHNTSDRDTKLSGFNVNLGGDLARCDVTSHLVGPGSESQMLALWFGNGEQHFDHHTLQHHAAPHAYSDLLYKGALDDSAESVFRGLIRVDEGAQLTDAYQTNRNLLLSEDSNAITLPNLEIEADDVRCSHGATVGQVDPGMLFYLMSRGLTRDRAERLLVFGFFDEVLRRIPVEGARRRIGEAIEEKIDL